MERRMEPEWLDELPPEDMRAVRSRQDLRRLNAIMGNAAILSKAMRRYCPSPRHIVELGAGDGHFLLSLVRRLNAAPGRLVLVDRQPCIADATFRQLRALGWTVDIAAVDVMNWAQAADPADAIVCNLFLHHLPPSALGTLFERCASKTGCLIGCEPARTGFALAASRLVGLIGCNAVTRHDAAVSVRAGFYGRELSALWPASPDWQLEERTAGLFSHFFAARRRP